MTATDDLQQQIARLREQVEALIKDHVTPAVAGLAGQAEYATDTLKQQADALAGCVKERPLASILIAGALGWLLGRLTR